MRPRECGRRRRQQRLFVRAKAGRRAAGVGDAAAATDCANRVSGRRGHACLLETAGPEWLLVPRRDGRQPAKRFGRLIHDREYAGCATASIAGLPTASAVPRVTTFLEFLEYWKCQGIQLKLGKARDFFSEDW